MVLLLMVAQQQAMTLKLVPVSLLMALKRVSLVLILEQPLTLTLSSPIRIIQPTLQEKL